MSLDTERVDNRVRVETPEAVEFDLDLAGVIPRTGAWMVDGFIKMFVIWAAAFLLIFLREIGVGLIFLVMFSLLWLYNPVFEILNQGRTPGKMVFDVRVVNRDGTPVGWYGAVTRNLIRVVDFLPAAYVTGIVSMVISGRFQRLGDLAGDTVVVYDRGAYETADVGRLPQAEPVKVPVVLQPHEQEAIVDFAERSRGLGRGRTEELAEILAPLTEASTAREATRSVFGLAQRIVRWG